MSKFKRNTNRGNSGIPTAALPDIIFILLFFFMVITKMKDVELKVINRIPQATEVQKLKKKATITYIYIGKPFDINRLGDEARIQVNDAFKSVKDIGPHIRSVIEDLPENKRKQLTVSLKIDKKVKMGIVNDVKDELREAKALKINYATTVGRKK